ncbi:MAG: glycosyltransferase family A protein [bacterium]
MSTPPDHTPLVSVIIPSFNSGQYLEAAVQSVLNQTYGNFELFIVDDGSADESLLMAKRLATRDPSRIFVLRHPDEKNHGVAETRNLALAAARGKYIAFLDADDRWFPEKLARQVPFMEARPELGLTYTKSRILRKGEGHQFIPGVEVLGGKPPKGRKMTLIHVIQVSLNYVFSSVMVRADCIRAVGGFPAKLIYQSEDRLMVAKVSADHEIALIPEVLCDYLAHPSNYSVNAVKGGIIPAVFFDMRVHIVKWLNNENGKPAWARQIARGILPDSFVAALLCSTQPRIRHNVMENLSETLKLYPHYLPLIGIACIRHSRIGSTWRKFWAMIPGNKKPVEDPSIEPGDVETAEEDGASRSGSRDASPPTGTAHVLEGARPRAPVTTPPSLPDSGSRDASPPSCQAHVLEGARPRAPEPISRAT